MKQNKPIIAKKTGMNRALMVISYCLFDPDEIASTGFLNPRFSDTAKRHARLRKKRQAIVNYAHIDTPQISDLWERPYEGNAGCCPNESDIENL